MDLNFDSGIKTYNINGLCEVSFNPTDSNFVSRIFDVFEGLDAMQERFKAEVDGASGKAVFDIARKMDGEMRTAIDGIFNQPVCASIFGDMNLYAMAGGLPVWCNMMLALIDVTDSSFAAEKKQTSAALAKYTKKYQKK